jgi:hypothetical protein
MVHYVCSLKFKFELAAIERLEQSLNESIRGYNSVTGVNVSGGGHHSIRDEFESLKNSKHRSSQILKYGLASCACGRNMALTTVVTGAGNLLWNAPGSPPA